MAENSKSLRLLYPSNDPPAFAFVSAGTFPKRARMYNDVPVAKRTVIHARRRLAMSELRWEAVFLWFHASIVTRSGGTEGSRETLASCRL